MENSKNTLIEIFRRNVKGKVVNVSTKNQRHDGKEGHWLEEQFSIHANASNEADILGYELKNETSSGKTTFGDWSANRYIFKAGRYASLFKGKTAYERQDSFCRIFGKPNEEKDGRFSWSGSPIPKINKWNDFGQNMVVKDNQDIVIYYSYSKDRRENKHTLIPVGLQNDDIELARWFGRISPSSIKTDKCLREKLEDKFADQGWFTCKKDTSGKYNKICFGTPIRFDAWIELVKKEIVFFDSGMYEGNKRPYSQWRANNDFWNSLIIDCYE